MNKLILFILLGTSILTIAQKGPQHDPSQFAIDIPIENGNIPFYHKGSRIGETKQGAMQKNSTLQIDSSYTFHWDSIGQNWKIYAKIVNHCDVQGNKKEKLIQIMNDNHQWENYLKTNYSFSTIDTVEVEMIWVNGDWENSTQKTLTYDTNHNNISSTNKVWNPSSAEWIIGNIQIIRTFDNNKNELTSTTEMWTNGIRFTSSRITKTYENNNKPKSSLREDWTFFTGVWQKKDSISYSYDLTHSESRETKYIRNGSTWLNDTYTEYFYNGAGLPQGVLMKKWDGSSWINDSQFVDMVWGNGMEMPLSYKMQDWINNAWVDKNRVSNSFNAFNNETGTLSENWTGSSWVNYVKSIYRYNSNNQLIGESSKIWNSDGSKMVYGDSTAYFIQTVISGLKKALDNDNQLTVYQTKNTDELILNNTSSDINSIALFSTSGQKVYERFNINQPSYNLNISKFNKGIYILSVKHGTAISTRKIIRN
jgi:hypothetical protein